MRGWPVTITESSLLDAPVALRPVQVRDARVWRDSRVRNATWLRPWEPTNPETPLYRSGLGPYITMARTMRREARQGLALPWVITYGGRFTGQLTVGSIIWGSARSAQVGYWIDEAAAGRGVTPTALAMAVGPCFMVGGPHRGEARSPAGDHGKRRGGGEVGVPGGGPAPPLPAHRRRLARSPVLRPDGGGSARRPHGPLARHAVGAAIGHRELSSGHRPRRRSGARTAGIRVNN